MRLMTWIATRLLGIFLLGAGIYKIFCFKLFVIALSSYTVVPNGAEVAIAPAVIGAELWLGVCLLGGLWLKYALPSAVGLLSIFTVVLVLDHISGNGRSCGYLYTVTLGRGDLLHIAQNVATVVVTCLIWQELAINERPQ